MTSSYTVITDHTEEIIGVSINKIKHNFIDIYQIGLLHCFQFCVSDWYFGMRSRSIFMYDWALERLLYCTVGLLLNCMLGRIAADSRCGLLLQIE